MKKLILAFALLALGTPAWAQSVTVQQSATRVEAATNVAFAQAGVGVTSTATITVPAGLFAYITGLSADACADGTGGTTQVNKNIVAQRILGLPRN